MINNIFDLIPDPIPEELFQEILKTDQLRIERIVSKGHCSPEDFWYDQETAEWVILLKGRARILFDGRQQPVELNPGDYLNIPAHLKHRVTWTDPGQATVWLAIHYSLPDRDFGLRYRSSQDDNSASSL